MERISSSRVKQIIEIMWKNRWEIKMLFKVFLWLQCVSIGVLGMMETICLEDIGMIPRILCMLVFGMFFYWGEKWSQEELEALS